MTTIPTPKPTLLQDYLRKKAQQELPLKSPDIAEADYFSDFIRVRTYCGVYLKDSATTIHTMTVSAIIEVGGQLIGTFFDDQSKQKVGVFDEKEAMFTVSDDLEIFGQVKVKLEVTCGVYPIGSDGFDKATPHIAYPPYILMRDGEVTVVRNVQETARDTICLAKWTAFTDGACGWVYDNA